MPRDHGGPAFPVESGAAHRIAIRRVGKGDEVGYMREHDALEHGMTLRDYFAAKALQGILANPGWTNRPDEVDGTEAKAAYLHADAMLAERRRG